MTTFTISNKARTQFVQFTPEHGAVRVTRATKDAKSVHAMSIEAARAYYKALLVKGFTRKLKQPVEDKIEVLTNEIVEIQKVIDIPVTEEDGARDQKRAIEESEMLMLELMDEYIKMYKNEHEKEIEFYIEDDERDMLYTCNCNDEELEAELDFRLQLHINMLNEVLRDRKRKQA